MKRAFIIVLDSFGIGATNDAKNFGDQGADTLGHIAEACFKGYANTKLRQGPLKLPNLTALGLGKAAEQSTGKFPLGLNIKTPIIGAYAYASEISSAKDTPTGHWELAGVPVFFDWDYFIRKRNSFPPTLLNKLMKRAKLPGYLGNCHASGTVIINQLGEEHLKTCKPIFYTSKDSVFQIACNEDSFGLDHLYQLCKITRETLNEQGYKICRVIARPFIGTKKENFKRTGNRYDLVIEPYAPTMLKKLVIEKAGTVISIGKIADIYAYCGITRSVKATGLHDLFEATLKEIKLATDNTIVFTNFVDFDSVWGHRRDVAGYATELEFFDRRIPELLSILKDNDILIITADHGCDPTWHGTDHTREHIPVLIYGPKIYPGYLGKRETFADISQTIAKYFGLTHMDYGRSML
ncbi:MAG: phosphopentomutase [Candidatus Dasytiphilus stammeri]